MTNRFVSAMFDYLVISTTLAIFGLLLALVLIGWSTKGKDKRK